MTVTVHWVWQTRADLAGWSKRVQFGVEYRIDMPSYLFKVITTMVENSHVIAEQCGDTTISNWVNSTTYEITAVNLSQRCRWPVVSEYVIIREEAYSRSSRLYAGIVIRVRRTASPHSTSPSSEGAGAAALLRHESR